MHKYIFTCLITFFSTSLSFADVSSELYRSNYEKFWVEWHKSESEFKKCTDYQNSSKFIADALEMGTNAEVNEANIEVIENLVVNNPKCVIEAILILPNK